MPLPHEKILKSVAARHLRSLGLKQQGRSRTWLDDRGWFLTVVEFQPGRGRGSYLNVGAHFLWLNPGHLTFDWGYRVRSFVSYVNDEQFERNADELAAFAASEVVRIRDALPTAASVAVVLPESEDCYVSYHRAVAQRISGDLDRARVQLKHAATVATARNWMALAVASEELLSVISDASAFQAMLDTYMSRQRNALKLPPRTAVAV